ncbi:hypothetical protein [Nocardia sp. NPDC003726]
MKTLRLKPKTDRLVDDELTSGALPDRVEHARSRLTLQHDPALIAALSESELAAEREDAEWIRAQRRTQRRRQVAAELAAEQKAMNAAAAEQDADIRDRLTARAALAEQRRADSPQAKVAELHRLRTWSARGLMGVVAAGVMYSAVNVQHNLAPNASVTDPLYWASYFIEALVSICLIVLMVNQQKASEWGVGEENRGLIIAAELFLLSLTIGLNTYPYLDAGDTFGFVTHAIAPVMIGVAILIHHASSERFGLMLKKATAQLPADDVLPPMTTVHRIAERVTAAAALEHAPVVPLRDNDATAEGDPAPEPALRDADARTPQSQTRTTAGPASAADPAVRVETRSGAGEPALTPAVRPAVPAPAPAVEPAPIAAETAPEAVASGNDASLVRIRTENPQPGDTALTDAVTAREALTTTDTPHLGQARAGEELDPTQPMPVLAVQTRTPIPDPTPQNETRTTSDSAGAQRPEWMAPVYELAAEVQRRGTAKTKPLEMVASVIASIDAGESNNAIVGAAKAAGAQLSHHTVTSIRNTAAEIRREHSGIGGGQIIELRKQGTDR